MFFKSQTDDKYFFISQKTKLFPLINISVFMADRERQKELSPLTGTEGMGRDPEALAESETK